MPKINSLEVVHQDTNKDQFETLHDILVELKQSLALNQELVDGDARVAIENLLEMYVNDKEAFLRSLQTLTAQFKTSEAKYEEEILLQASALEALARRTTTLTAQTENNIASVREYSEAVASEVALKVTTYRQDEPPTENLSFGDLWFDTNDNNKLYRWNGLVWVETTDNSALESFIATEYSDDIAAISSQVDAKAETWFQETDPSTAWTTQSIRDMHDKDMWYKASTKTLKIYVASTNTWTTIEDQTAINAATAASTAQSTADGKVVTFAQSSTPVAEGEGDIWMDTGDNNRTYRWNGSYWEDLDNGGATAYSRWGVQVNANGNVAGIQLNSDSTGTSEFTVLANAFRVYNGSTSVQAFTVTGGQVYISNNLKVSGNIISGGTVAGVNLDAFGNLTTNSTSGYVAITNVRSNSVRASSSNTKPISDAIITTDATVRMKVDGSLEVGKNIVAYGTITPFTGAHRGVTSKSTSFRQGQLLVDSTLYDSGDISSTYYFSELSSTPNQKGIVGVYVEDYYEQYEDVHDGSITIVNPLSDGNKYVIFNGVGEGKVLVNGENGNISRGDLIVSSSTAGIGMKQDDDIIRSYTVAKARENITFSSPTEEKLVPCIYLCG